MNTSQIKYALEQDPLTRKIFRGVFPSDKLPQTIEKYPCGSVANTDPSNKPGTHWVAFYFPSEEQGGILRQLRSAAKFLQKIIQKLPEQALLRLEIKYTQTSKQMVQCVWTILYILLSS